jgi:conjugal transfer mating pair stabilization protein TraN
MKEVIATLSIFDEMKKDTGTINPSIFKGAVGRCTKAFGGFKNCCGTPKGWGRDLNLSDCNGEDMALSQKRAKGLCVYVGSFCAEKLAGICIRKKASFCCFDSKISRIFHEQGRAQLGIGWGDGATPQCRGLSLEEIQKIDFSKIDLGEIHEELLKHMKRPAADHMGASIKDRITAMTQGISTPKVHQGGM